MAAAGWCASKTSTRRAACRAPTASSCSSWPIAACTPTNRPLWQSQRSALYQQALDELVARGLAYPCGCSRRDIEAALQRLGRGAAAPRRAGLPGHLPRRPARQGGARLALCAMACRDIDASHPLDRPSPGCADSRTWRSEVGDFVLQRADGCYAYQLAVVVDDARARHHRTSCAARIWPTTRRARSCCNARWVCRHRLPAHAAGAGGQRREALQAKRRPGAGHARSAAGAATRPRRVLDLQVSGTTVGDWLAAATGQWTTHWGPPGKIRG